jgi:hypothetical protein
MQAGPAYGNIREEGYTFVAKSVFQNKEDMEHYETDCQVSGYQRMRLISSDECI